MLYTVHTLPAAASSLPGYAIGAFLEHANMAIRAGLPDRDAIAVGVSAARVKQEEREQSAERTDKGARRVGRVDRYNLKIDASTVVRHPNGWVDVWGVATRVGVFDYEDPTKPGGIFREYRPADEVLDPASIVTLDGVPFTIEHPDDGVDAGNARELTHGWVLEVKVDGDLVLARIRVATEDALAAIQAGKLELSCGYTTKLDLVAGVTDRGEAFDAIQRDIRYNHLALVDLARAGHVARLRFDSLRVQRQDSGKAIRMQKFKLTFDGKTYECPALMLPGLRHAHVDTARTKSTRSDLKTAAVRIEMEGEEPADLVLPEAMVAEMVSMLPGMGAGGDKPAEAPEGEDEMPAEPAPEPEPVGAGSEGESPEGAPAPMEEPEDGDGMKRGDAAVTRADLDAALERERKRADAAARHRASVERKAATVLDAGFDYGSKTTEQIQAATIAAVHADKADSVSKVVADVVRGDARAAGVLDATFDAAIETAAARRQADVDAATMNADGGATPRAAANRVDAARQAMIDRMTGKAS